MNRLKLKLNNSINKKDSFWLKKKLIRIHYYGVRAAASRVIKYGVNRLSGIKHLRRSIKI